MKAFADYEEQEQKNIVQIMRAQFDCHHSREAWLEAAKYINPTVIYPSYTVTADIILDIAKQAGERVIR